MSDEAEPETRMTIGVYRVGPDGARATVREKQPVTPVTEISMTDRWPACACPLHRGRP